MLYERDMLKCKTCEAGVLKKFDGHFEDGPPTAVARNDP